MCYWWQTKLLLQHRFPLTCLDQAEPYDSFGLQSVNSCHWPSYSGEWDQYISFNLTLSQENMHFTWLNAHIKLFNQIRCSVPIISTIDDL